MVLFRGPDPRGWSVFWGILCGVELEVDFSQSFVGFCSFVATTIPVGKKIKKSSDMNHKTSLGRHLECWMHIFSLTPPHPYEVHTEWWSQCCEGETVAPGRASHPSGILAHTAEEGSGKGRAGSTWGALPCPWDGASALPVYCFSPPALPPPHSPAVLCLSVPSFTEQKDEIFLSL